jgi:hypothetical protein
MAQESGLKVYGTSVTLCTFNSLTNNTAGTAGTAWDNRGTGTTVPAYTHADVEIITSTFGTARTAGAILEVLLSYAPDGTNYSDIVAGFTDVWTSQILPTGTGATRYLKKGLDLNPCLMKGAVVNRATQTTGASGNSCILYPYYFLSV